MGGWGEWIVCKGQQEQPQPLTTLVIAKLLGMYPPVLALLCLDGLYYYKLIIGFVLFFYFIFFYFEINCIYNNSI